MEAIFNILATSKLIFIITLLVLTTAIVLIIFKYKLLKKGIIGIGIVIVLSAILFFTSSLYWSKENGYVHHITHLSVCKNKLIFFDNRKRSTARYSTLGMLDLNRLYIVDMENGKRLYRGYLGIGMEWRKDKDNLMLLSNSKTYNVFDIDKTEIVRKIDKEYFIKNFIQCSAGIDNISYIKDFIIIKSKDGLIYYYEPFSDKIVAEPDPSHYLYKKYSCYYDKIIYIENGSEKEIFKFKSLIYGEKRTHLFRIDDAVEKKVYSDESFIEGSCIGFSPDNNLILILSYENTDKEKYIFTALNMNLITQWKINHETLAPDDFFSDKKPLVTDAVLNNNNIYIGIGGFVYCIETASGKIKWKQRF